MNNVIAGDYSTSFFKMIKRKFFISAFHVVRNERLGRFAEH